MRGDGGAFRPQAGNPAALVFARRRRAFKRFSGRGGVFPFPHAEDARHGAQGSGKVAIEVVFYQMEAVAPAIGEVRTDEAAAAVLVVVAETVTSATAGAGLMAVGQGFRRDAEGGVYLPPLPARSGADDVSIHERPPLSSLVDFMPLIPRNPSITRAFLVENR